jgi:S1/P1 Nuclease
LIAGTPTAKKVRQILGSNLQTASVWADCARSVELVQGQWRYTEPGQYKECALYETEASKTALIAFVKRNASRCAGNATYAQCRHKSYHFTDIAIQRSQYDPGLPGANPNDLVHALDATITVLQGGKSPAPINVASPREALRLLTHYVGDLHQPLHVGSVYLSDAGQPLDPATPKEAHDHDNAGGNKILYKGWKLHSTWDDVPGKLTTALIGGQGATEARSVPATAGAITQWPASADEPAYRRSREALQHAQLVKAGARLAQILTTLYP